MPLNLPSSYPGDPSGYVTYYKAQADNYSMSAVYARNPLETQATLNWEMSSMLANCSRSIATKVYVADAGNWSTAANWFPTGVPAAGDNVLIGEGVSVTYDVDAPTTSLSFVRIDGTLYHPHNASTAMNVNTIFVTPTGKHQVATESTPLSASRTCRIIFSSSTDMDASVDTALQTKGIVSAGTRLYFGASKTHRTQVALNSGPAAGATGIVLELQPSGWKVGDRITISGTRFRWPSFAITPFECEEETRTITSIGLTGTISLNTALTYGHTAPSSTLVAANTMRAYVANLTRNIQFSTENGSTALRHRRAHDMQMHYPTFDARWVEWRDMGRTNKGYISRGVINAGANGTSGTTISPGNTTLNGSLAVNNTVSLSTEGILFIINNSSPPQNLIVEGFDRSGTAISNTITWPPGSYFAETPRFYTRITRVYPSSANCALSIDVNNRSRLITSLGIRNTNGGIMNQSSWTYEPPYREANIQGRYPVHFHKCGILGDVFTAPISMLGCVVSGSPGWGFVHHLSHANFVSCVSHDMPGAGFSAEAGNETGLWKDCYATRVLVNVRPQNTFKGEFDVPQVDPGRGGGFFFSGRMVKVVNCVATDCMVGYWYNSRFQQQNLIAEQLDQPASLYGLPNGFVDESPVIHFTSNVSVACRAGFFLTKNSPFQRHDIRTVLKDHFSWGCAIGMKIEYTAHYTMDGFTAIRGDTSDIEGQNWGFEFGGDISDQTLKDFKIDGFYYGIGLFHANANDPSIASLTTNGRILIDPVLRNVVIDYPDRILYSDKFLTSASLTNTASLSLSLTTDGVRKWVNGPGPVYLRDDNAVFWYTGWRLAGQKKDRLLGQVGPDLEIFPGGIWINRERDYPFMDAAGGVGGAAWNYARRWGVFEDPVLGLTHHIHGFWSDRVTGDLQLKMVPAKISPAHASFMPQFKRGNADYSKYDATDGLPNPQSHRISLGRNTTTNLNLLQGATHSLSISMYVAAITKPYNCHIVDNENNTVTIVPPVDFAGTETFSYWVADNNANVTKQSVIVEVRAFEATTGIQGVADFASTTYNAAVSVNVLANDVGDSKVLVSATVVGGNATGTASISTGGVIVFTPSTLFATTATQVAEIQYVFSASGGAGGASLYVTVNPAPSTGRAGVNDFAAMLYGQTIAVDVLSNDVGDSKSLASVTVVGGSTVGTASMSTGGIIVFTAAPTFAVSTTQTATVQYTFTASGGSAGASLFVTVNPPPTGRAGVADFASTTYNQAVSVNVLANDVGDNKVLLTATVVGGNAIGTASISTGGVIVFTPSSTFAVTQTGVAEIQYTFTASGGSAGASLFVTVNGGPITGRSGVNDFIATQYNTAVSANVLANDIGDSKALLTATVVGGNSVGTASISTGGVIVFTPTSTFARTITMTAEIQYTFTASGGSAGASLFVTVNAGPPLPQGVADFTSTTYNQAVSFNVLANDTGDNKSLLTATVVGGNSVGTASISTGGVIVFTPTSTFATTLTQVAEVQYTYTASGGSSGASLFITVNAGPSQPASATFTPPVATDGTAQVYVGRSNGIFVLRQAYDTNENGYIVVNSAIRVDGVLGNVDFDPAGVIYVTPDSVGQMRVQYRVINGGALTASGIMTLFCVAAPSIGDANAGGGAMIGAPVSWSRKNVSNIKSVAKAISKIFGDLDPNDPIRLAERMVRKYSFAEVKKLIGTADFESLLDMELQELVEEMERIKNGN